MEVVPLKTLKMKADEAVVSCLEGLLADAKAGKIHRLLVIGINDMNGETNYVRHRCVDPTLMGAVSAVLSKLQREWFP